VRDLSIVLHDGTIAQFAPVEALLDTKEKLLIVMGDEGESIKFNWDYVVYYIDLPLEEAEEAE
jgi:hypothetical protein